MMRSLHVLCSTFIFVWLSIAGSAAQTLSTDVDASVGQITRQIELLAERFQSNLDSEDVLVDINGSIDGLQTEALALGLQLTERFTAVRTRLDQLGAPPAEGEPEEPELVSAERDALQQERARINLLIGQLEDASIASGNLRDDIAERRRELFTETLSQRYDITQAFGEDFWADLADRGQKLQSRVSSWASFTWRVRSDAVIGAVALSLLIGFGAVLFSRRTYGALIHRDQQHQAPTFFARLTVGFWYTLLPTLVFWAWLGITYLVFDYFGVWRQDIADLAITLFGGLAILYLVIRLSRAVFAPYIPNWRLINVPQNSAIALHLLMILMAVIVVADAVITRFNVILGVSIPVTVVLSLLTSIAVGVVLIAMGRVQTETRDDEGPSDWPGWVRALLVFTGAALILLAIAGYLGSARFAAQQIVTTGAILATMYLGYRAARAIGETNALAQTAFGESLKGRYQLSDLRVDQLGLVSGALLMFAVFVIGAPVIALLWGFRSSEITQFAYSFITNIQFGSISISIVGIFAGLLLFVLGFWATRLFQRWLDGTVLERGGVEQGARNSIRTAVGYAGFALAALLGVSAAGIDLTQLAFIAGALSLGIGFGLQNIVSNFVSGLILLAERPFKAGDIIEAGGFTGTVNKVNVRATEITTFDRKTLILPNSELINGSVTNWIHKSTLGRVQIPVGVSYETDAKQVHDMLLEIANDHPRVLSNPEPFVAFDHFGDSSLDFVLYAYLADIGFGLTVRTELRMAILERFRAANIEIPFPQRDINIKAQSSSPVETIPKADAEFGVIETTKARHIDDE